MAVHEPCIDASGDVPLERPAPGSPEQEAQSKSASNCQHAGVAFIASDAGALLRFRGGVMAALSGRGVRVLALVPTHSESLRAALVASGADVANFDPRPLGLAFMARRALIQHLSEQLRAWRPGMVVLASADVAEAGQAAARAAGVPKLAAYAYDGVTFSANGTLSVTTGYKKVIAACDAAVVHSEADRAATKCDAVRVVPGTLTDSGLGAAVPMPPLDGKVCVLMVAEKGSAEAIADYLAVADAVAPTASNLRFQLAHAPWAEADGVGRFGEVEYLGPITDVAKALAGCHAVVHLTAEDGVPKLLLEALAAGRSVITINAPGCLQLVDQGVNGWIVPAGNRTALEQAVRALAANPELLVAEGRASRLKAERRFGAGARERAVLDALGLPV